MSVTESPYDAARTTSALIRSWMGGDEKANEEAVFDATTELDADEYNKIVAAIGDIGARTRPGTAPVALHFELANIPGTATTAATPVGIGHTETAYRLFRDGTLVGISCKLNTNKTSGTLTVQPKIDGVNCALSLDISDATDGDRAHQLVAAAAASDVADAVDLDDIELDIITSSFTPVTADGIFTLWFNIGEEEGI